MMSNDTLITTGYTCCMELSRWRVCAPTVTGSVFLVPQTFHGVYRPPLSSVSLHGRPHDTRFSPESHLTIAQRAKPSSSVVTPGVG